MEELKAWFYENKNLISIKTLKCWINEINNQRKVIIKAKKFFLLWIDKKGWVAFKSVFSWGK